MTDSKAVNFILFQVTWFSCVLGAVHGRAWLGPVVALVAAAVNVAGSARRARRVLFFLVVVFLGSAGDLIPLNLGAYSFPNTVFSAWGYPLWMSALWLGFGTTLVSSLKWLSMRPYAAGGLGFVGGPLAYWAGERLGAVELGVNKMLSLVVIGVFWALITPLLTKVSLKME